MASPSVLVTDTNIWIDLENGGILTEAFGLTYQFLTPDFAIRELVRPKWPAFEGFFRSFLAPLALCVEE